jgi:hypothetical protein
MFTLNPYDKEFLDTLGFLIKLIAGGGGLYLFFKGLQRYLKDQTWRRNEFVAKEIKDFTSDPMVKNIMSILDWGSRYVELFPAKANYDDRFAKVDRPILKSALQYHKFKTTDPAKDRFTRTEVAIRDNFDCFLSYFERFEHFIEAGLITPEELKPYLRYWIDTISENMEDDVRNFINHYIDKYEYKGTQNLFKRFNKNIFPTTDIETTRIL